MRKNGTTLTRTIADPDAAGRAEPRRPMVTGGGVTFMSATLDYYLRAYDTRTGHKLGRRRRRPVATATPMSYVSDKTGRHTSS